MARLLPAESRSVALARVLLANDDPASRLTLQTVLEASGYEVDAAASAAEAVGKLDQNEYELVLTDLHMESLDSGLRVLAYARMMDYKPATALLTTYLKKRPKQSAEPVLIEAENVPELLDKVADLISERAQRRVRRTLALRQAV